MEQVSEGKPDLADGAPKKNQKGLAHWMPGRRGAPCDARVFRSSLASAEADGLNRSMSFVARSDTGLPPHSDHPKATRLTRTSACSHEESGCSVLAAPESRVPTHLSQRRWQANAPTRTLPGLRPRATVFPDRDCKQPRSAATGLCAAATLTSQCLRRNTPKGALTADAPQQPREADSTLRTTLQHPERRRNGHDSRTADPLASGRRQRLLLQIRHRDCSRSLLPASNSSCFTAPRTARFLRMPALP